MILALAVAAQAPHVFRYTPSVATTAVSVAGTFNGWNKDSSPMKKGADGTWSVALPIPVGKHTYKFVENGERWVADPLAKKEDDGNGNINSVLLIVPAGWEKPAKLGDGRVTAAGLSHDPKRLATTYDRGRLRFDLRTRVGDVKAVDLHLRRPNATACEDVKLKPSGADELYQSWTGTVPWDGKTDLRYNFLLKDGKNLEYGGDKLSVGPDEWYRLVAKTFRPFVTPSWVPGAVVYQIFPDRFANGDPSNDPKDVQPWLGTPTYFNRFGGDAAGLSQKAGYLKELGVTTAYFTPVFASPSNHRYDTSDYRRIDPQIGTNAEFAKATADLKKNGIGTVLDIAFNHTATDHQWFLDLREKGQESRFKTWYYPKSYPIQVKENPNYEAWFGFPSMPKLNVMNPVTKTELLNLPSFWRKSFPGLKGLRMDVANEIDQRFWREFRVRVKSDDPQSWIVGEEWGNASQWLQGDQWDAQMNYPFREATIGFLVNKRLGAKAYWANLERVRNSVPPQVARVQMNLLGSHDTARWASVCTDRRLADIGATMLFAWVGAPTIYYGDELGMLGEKDPDNRRAMRWDLVNAENPTLKLYRSLIAARRSSKALQEGDPVLLSIAPTDDALAFRRGADAVVAVNRSEEPRTLSVNLTRPHRDAISGQIFPPTSSLRLRPMQSVLLLPVAKTSSLGSAPRTAPQSFRLGK